MWYYIMLYSCVAFLASCAQSRYFCKGEARWLLTVAGEGRILKARGVESGRPVRWLRNRAGLIRKKTPRENSREKKTL